MPAVASTNDAALSVEGAGDTKITLVGDNKLTSGNQCAGLEHNEESTGTTGKLTITSGTDTEWQQHRQPDCHRQWCLCWHRQRHVFSRQRCRHH